jgi:hypothetical protein
MSDKVKCVLTMYSDIVAELPCPHSGILTYEDDMPSPNFQAASDHDGFPPIVMESYGAQLFLRKHLNQLHNMFYRPENGERTCWSPTLFSCPLTHIRHPIPICSCWNGTKAFSHHRSLPGKS